MSLAKAAASSLASGAAPRDKRNTWSRARCRAALAVVAWVIGIDFYLSAIGMSLWVRALQILPLATLLMEWSGWDRRAVGLVARPRPSWRYWVLGALLAGLAQLLVAAAYAAVAPDFLADVALRGIFLRADMAAHLVRACVEAPLVEEALYRLGADPFLHRVFTRLPHDMIHAASLAGFAS